MKDKKKIIVPLLLAGVTATGVVSNVAQVQKYDVQAETSDITNVVGAEIKVGRFQSWNGSDLVNTDTFKVGDRVYLPEVYLESGFTAVYTIKKDKKEFKPTKVEAGKDGIEEGDPRIGSYYFDAEYQGYYDITISAESTGEGVNHVTTTLTNLSVFVERETATIKLPTNSKYVIPAKIQKSQAGLKIPAPTVLFDNESGEEVEEKVHELTLGRTFNVYLVTPTAEKVQLSLDSTNSYYEVTDASKLDNIGTYHIVYEYKEDATVISRLESSFQVVKNYDTSNIELKMKFQSSMPSKGNVNTDISIPKVTVVDENASSSDSINAYVNVKITNLDTNEVIDVDYENFTFHPVKEGRYAVTYIASIELFGTNCKTAEITPGDPIVVSDNEAPKVIPTYAYTFVDGEIATVNGETVTVDAESGQTQREKAEEMLEVRKVDIPSVAIKGQEFTIPAAYATDNFYKYSDQTEDIVIVRTYRSSTGSVSTVSEKPNELGKITFNEKGNAEIRYKATDKAGNTLGESVYDIVVYDSADELKDGKTTIKLNVGTSIVSDKEKTLTFAKPTATDTYDKNVDVKTYLVYGTERKLLTETNSDGKYEVNISEITKQGCSEFTIVAEATVDSVLEGTRGETPITTTKSHPVTIQKVDSDNSIPEFNILGSQEWNTELLSLNNEIKADANGSSIDEAGYLIADGSKIVINADAGLYMAPFDQSSNNIKIPAVKFTDKHDSNLSISIEIKDRKGNRVSKVEQEHIEKSGDETNGYTYEVSGAQFKLSSYGVYTVTFKAQDYAGNIVIRSYGIRVNDKTAPTITIIDEDKFNDSIEVGEYFEVPTATLKKEGEDIDGTTRWEIYNKSAGADCIKSNNGFTPTSEGTFFIRYYGVDELGNETKLEDSTFIVTAKDTIAPTITIDNNVRLDTEIEWAPATGTDYMEINIPVAFATDENRGQVDVVYTITGPNGIKPTVSDHATYGHLKTFKATAEGTYTVVYSAVDEAGNESKVEKTISVGDCVPPTIEWKDKDSMRTEINLNEIYTFNYNDELILSDDGTNASTEQELRERLTITLTSPDGTSVTNRLSNNSGYEWEFTKTGNYTMKITVKDKVGNSTTETWTFNVPADEAESKKVSPVLGTVLVVLSVVVLGGVIVYFVASNKKKPGKKSTSKK